MRLTHQQLATFHTWAAKTDNIKSYELTENRISVHFSKTIVCSDKTNKEVTASLVFVNGEHYQPPLNTLLQVNSDGFSSLVEKQKFEQFKLACDNFANSAEGNYYHIDHSFIAGSMARLGRKTRFGTDGVATEIACECDINVLFNAIEGLNKQHEKSIEAASPVSETNKMEQVASCLSYNDPDKSVQLAKHYLLWSASKIEALERGAEEYVKNSEYLAGKVNKFASENASAKKQVANLLGHLRGMMPNSALDPNYNEKLNIVYVTAVNELQRIFKLNS